MQFLAEFRDIICDFASVNNEFPFTTSFKILMEKAAKFGKYYTYQGSLTTPGCNEAVTWIVYRNSIRFVELNHLPAAHLLT